MISTYLQQLFILVKRLAICYFIYFICRAVFYFANASFFSSVPFLSFLKTCFYGLRTDSFSIVVSNSLFILLSVLPLNGFWQAGYQRVIKWVYVIGNALFVALNCIDIAYFPFIRKRSGADLLEQIGGQSDVLSLIPSFIRDFWWALLLYVLLLFFMHYLYTRISLPVHNPYSRKQPKHWLVISALFILSTGFSVLAVRGGLQRVPITIVEAAAMVSPEEAPIVFNTPFTLIKSLEEKPLSEYSFYSPDELASIYQPIRHYRDSIFTQENVVVIILESFAREYTKLGRKSITPFLDSLMDWSLVCENAFSNGSKSIEGIPAILSGMPSFMENPFINSPYSLNNQTSLAGILNQEGYHTAFFHGGINGTMNFDSWAALAGYTRYFGKKEYNNNRDFDQVWGIWDEPFLHYSVKEMNAFKTPFHTAIFTLSSHHPYKIPEQYSEIFPKGDLENSQSIAYADYALRMFFNSAKQTNWYSNTLFVLTADHGSVSNHPFYRNVVGHQGIPVLFFRPDNSLKRMHKPVFSQIDILPSTLNLLGYNKPFFSFGESFSEEKYGNDYFYANGTHFLYGDSMMFSFKAGEHIQTFNYRADSSLSQNRIHKHPVLDSVATLKFKAFLQTYNYSLIHNKCTLK